MSSEEDWKHLFKLFDKKEKGTVRTTRLPVLMRSLGRHPSNAYLAKVAEEVGKDITLDKFMELMKAPEKEPQGTLDAAFTVLSNDGTTIDMADLRQMMTALGEKLSDDEFDELLHDVDFDTDKPLSMAQLKDLLVPSA